MKPSIGLPIAALLFALLATANSGGYRYGVSDQAFYGPALARALDPALFPRDSVVLAPQMRVWLGDDVLAGLTRVFSLDQPGLFALVYAVTLIALFVAAVWVARSLGGSWTMVGVFVALLTLRHRIAKTGANSLEGYMHPRMLAFALGLAAVASILRRRPIAALVWVTAAGVIHPTTAGWFGIVVGVALVNRIVRARWLALAVGAVGVLGVWALLAGPLAGRVQVMDADWLSVLAERDYLFPSEWPAYAWAANLAYVAVIWLVYRRRRAAGVVAPGEPALMTGLAILVIIFFLSVPLSAARVALAVQLQVNRVFWLLDVVTAVYVAWWLAVEAPTKLQERSRGGGSREHARVGVAIVCALLLVSASRGYYVLRVETGRPLVDYALPRGEWTDAMTWLRAQPPTWHVLADPDHALKWGPGVRLAALKDTLVERGKDPSMAMYDRTVAMRVRARAAALSGFDRMTTSDVRALDDRFALDVFVTETARPFELPVLYRNRRFVVYDLR